jgi:transcriptional regulator with XRE-family HTH domain
MVIIGQNISQIRKVLKISQSTMAKELGTSQVQLSRYEKGDRTPDGDFLLKIKNKYQIDINWLISGDGEMFLGGVKEDKPIEVCDEVKEAFKKLPEERQKYFYCKIISESME